MELYDCHIHSTFSPDGKSRVSEYADVIGKGGLKGIGFAEHLDFLPECGAYGFLDYRGYTASVKEYRDKGYAVYAGAEVDYSLSVQQEILKRLNEESYDFTICSIHNAGGRPVSDRKTEHFYDRDIFFNTIESYYKELKSSIKVEVFDAIGHIGVFRRHLTEDFYRDEKLNRWLDELDDEVARLCASSDKIVEVNSSGLFSACNSILPRVSILKAYFNYRGRRVCMSSDAHDVLHTARGFDTVREILLDIGFRHVYLPWDKEHPANL
ncbi:histidinol-phosphatase (PHP family) [Anaerobacterium chartisolvens]|uniref:Histidinol-phosphatase n=2 Tax=Anaerobacterium chartisolvens TaxID=1297424 RepID=A0A369B9H5_9FIRM|nr:histidinol-phosphatase (PHP family) [Anaerobacterium chartisolvens]